MKYCNKCGLEKQTSEFSINSAKLCKLCKNKQAATMRNALSARENIIYAVRQICRTCGIDKPVADFNRKNVCVSGLNLHCRDCTKTSNKRRVDKIAETRVTLPDQTKVCFICKEVKLVSEFASSNYQSDGLLGICVPCQKVERKNYVSRQKKNDPRRYSADSMYRRMIYRVKQFGLKCNLMKADIYEMVEQLTYCPILGIPFNWSYSGKTATFGSPSLDKIDPTLGYVKGNAQIISYRANRLKRDASLQELVQLRDWAARRLAVA